MAITVLSTISETRAHLEKCRAAKAAPIVLVPTMGALHEGHAQLIRLGRERAGKDGTVVVSVFVNPTQFGTNEDIKTYPRNLKRDEEICQACEADVVFAPNGTEMYASDHSIEVRENNLSVGLCGTSRPGHFPGVCLVVMKLFGIVQPTHVVFGKKDYQQLVVIRRLVRDLNLPIEIIAAETAREEDGLAMSSRHENLSDAERKAAPGIRAGLLAGKEQWEKSPYITPGVLVRLVRSRLEQIKSGRIDYVELLDAETLENVQRIENPVVLAAAMFFSNARLIDNIEFGPAPSEG